MIKTIQIAPYNPNWPDVFKIESKIIKAALEDKCIAIHHVGSTSVEGLPAKPKIDIIAVVKNDSHPEFISESHNKMLKQVQHDLEKLGYKYRGGFNIPLRKCFTIRTADKNINLHIFEENDPEIELNLLFRDHLRKNPMARVEYVRLKYKLIAEESNHAKNDSIYTGYTLGKHDFIQNILKQSGFNKHRFVLCTTTSEWNAAKDFRRRYFFCNQDKYAWSFNHSEHAHLLLYQGCEIICYAHIQFWPDKRAAILIITTREDKRNQNAGSLFLALIEKWLNTLEIKSIHAESRESSLNFYLKNGYCNMPFGGREDRESNSHDIQVGKVL